MFYLFFIHIMQWFDQYDTLIDKDSEFEHYFRRFVQLIHTFSSPEFQHLIMVDRQSIDIWGATIPFPPHPIGEVVAEGDTCRTIIIDHERVARQCRRPLSKYGRFCHTHRRYSAVLHDIYYSRNFCTKDSKCMISSVQGNPHALFNALTCYVARCMAAFFLYRELPQDNHKEIIRVLGECLEENLSVISEFCHPKPLRVLQQPSKSPQKSSSERTQHKQQQSGKSQVVAHQKKDEEDIMQLLEDACREAELEKEKLRQIEAQHLQKQQQHRLHLQQYFEPFVVEALVDCPELEQKMPYLLLVRSIQEYIQNTTNRAELRAYYTDQEAVGQLHDIAFVYSVDQILAFMSVHLNLPKEFIESIFTAENFPLYDRMRVLTALVFCAQDVHMLDIDPSWENLNRCFTSLLVWRWSTESIDLLLDTSLIYHVLTKRNFLQKYIHMRTEKTLIDSLSVKQLLKKTRQSETSIAKLRENLEMWDTFPEDLRRDVRDMCPLQAATPHLQDSIRNTKDALSTGESRIVNMDFDEFFSRIDRNMK